MTSTIYRVPKGAVALPWGYTPPGESILLLDRIPDDLAATIVESVAKRFEEPREDVSIPVDPAIIATAIWIAARTSRREARAFLSRHGYGGGSGDLDRAIAAAVITRPRDLQAVFDGRPVERSGA